MCENCYLFNSETKKETFTVWKFFKEIPLFLKIILQRGAYDTEKDWVVKNECKVAIPSEYFIKKPSNNEKIPYTLVSLIMHDGDSLDCGNYASGVFGANTGI